MMMKIAPVKATITGSGTRFKYSLNDDSTLEKLKKNATLRDMVVDNNKNDNWGGPKNQSIKIKKAHCSSWLHFAS